MAKGLGGIIAEMEMSRPTKDKVACPLCGQDMEYNGAAWFCRADECEEIRTQVVDAYEGYDYQRQVLAGVVVDGQIIVEFRVVRGPYGRDSYRVGYEDITRFDNRVGIQDLIASHGWTWQDWVPDDIAGTASAIVIVTRHEGLVEWLRLRGIEGRVISHATADDIKGLDVVGILPLHLAAVASSVTVVDMPGLQPDQRGVDLTPDEMDAAGASIKKYKVTAVSHAK